MKNAVLDHDREELVHLAGDAPDPMADVLGFEHARGVGIQSTIRMTKQAKGHPKIRYKDFLLEADVYDLAGEPLWVHLICPRCHHALKISADKKSIDYDRAVTPELGGRLSVEPFMCTWELPEGRRQEFGIGLCRWRVAIDNNVAKDV